MQLQATTTCDACGETAVREQIPQSNDLGVITAVAVHTECTMCGRESRTTEHVDESLIEEYMSDMRDRVPYLRAADEIEEWRPATDENTVVVLQDPSGRLQQDVMDSMGRDLAPAGRELDRVLSELARIHVDGDRDWVFPPFVVVHPGKTDPESGVKCGVCGHDLGHEDVVPRSMNGESYSACMCSVCRHWARVDAHQRQVIES